MSVNQNGPDFNPAVDAPPTPKLKRAIEKVKDVMNDLDWEFKMWKRQVRRFHLTQ